MGQQRQQVLGTRYQTLDVTRSNERQHVIIAQQHVIRTLEYSRGVFLVLECMTSRRGGSCWVLMRRQHLHSTSAIGVAPTPLERCGWTMACITVTSALRGGRRRRLGNLLGRRRRGCDRRAPLRATPRATPLDPSRRMRAQRRSVRRRRRSRRWLNLRLQRHHCRRYRRPRHRETGHRCDR